MSRTPFEPSPPPHGAASAALDGGGGAADPAATAASTPDPTPDTFETQTPAGTDGEGAESETRPGSTGRSERVAAAARRWQRRLVELGGRNTLLWHEDVPTGVLDLTTAHPGGVSMLMAGRATRLSDLVREPSAFAEARRRAATIRDTANELDEQRGLLTCFMAIGMATWRVPGAPRPPQAPVLLRACTLHPIGAAHRDYDVDLAGAVEINPVLLHYLATRGIDVDGPDLADLAYTTQRFDPQPVFRELSRRCGVLSAFAIADRKVIGTFSYAKLPMVADLADLADDLPRHDVIAALAGDATAQGLAAADDAAPSGDVPPVRELLVLDADASQQRALEAARTGASIVIAGAPGTGKTQTIANLVGMFAGLGRRVLVVAHKRAAITGLLDRLGEAGLADLALDVHAGARDPSVASAAFLAGAGRGVATREPDVTDTQWLLTARRERLDRHRRYLHEPLDPWGVTAHEARSALTRLARGAHPPTSRVRLPLEVLRGIDRQGAARAGQALRDVAARGAWPDRKDEDPWAGARVLSADDVARATRLTTELAGSRLARDREILDGVLTDAGLPPAATARDWAAGLALMRRIADTLTAFDPVVFSAGLAELVDATGGRGYRREHGVRIGWWSRSALARQARGLLREGEDPSDLHEGLVAAADQRREWRERGGRPDASPRVPDSLARGREVGEALVADLGWLGERLSSTALGGDLLDTPLDELAERLGRLAGRTDRLAVLPEVIPLLDELDAAGLQPLAEDLATRRVSSPHAVQEMEFVWWASLLDAAATERAAAAAGEETLHIRECHEEFARLDAAYVGAGGRRVLGRVGGRLREARAMYADQAAFLAAQARLGDHHMPIRELVDYTADTLFAARPCWVMSPLVVASVLPPGQWFDVVVIDEASQVESAEAVSAITRARQVVVVGDEAQLPPVGFRVAPRDGDGAIGGAEPVRSVFDVLAARLPVHRLGRHYRSADERLFAFSNAHLYGGRVVTFPGTGAEPPVSLVTVGEGEEDVGGPAAGRPKDREVDRVVALALQHAAHRPTESLGIVTLDRSHARRIAAALRDVLDDVHDPGVIAFFDEAAGEPAFIRHLDLVQGDARDAIICSVGIASAGDGRVAHRVGALNVDGGDRRLNVALTRARRRLTIVSSLGPADLDTGRLKSRGAQMLQDVLAYAERGGDPGVLRQQIEAGRPSTSNVTPLRPGPREVPWAGGAVDPLLGELAERLRRDGLVVHERYGVSPEPLDLAVEDPYVPGRMAVAVESDGYRYGATDGLRDRERLRADQLRRLGWQYVRVWSEDLFADPAREVARVLEAVRVADAHTSAPARGREAAGGRPLKDLW